MLAALIATRQPAPPPPPLIFYSNQLVASTTTFSCIAIARKAGLLTTDSSVQTRFLVSLPGQECFVSQLTRLNAQLLSLNSSNNPIYLNNAISQVITILTVMTSILQTLPIVPTVQPVFMLIPSQSAMTPEDRITQRALLQQQLAVALTTLKTLGQIVTQNFLSSLVRQYGSEVVYGVSEFGTATNSL